MRITRLWPLLKSAVWGVWVTLFALVLLAFVIHVIGVTSLGDANRWVRWFQGHRLYFLLWRVLLYAITVYAWMPMRRRVLRAEADAAAAVRLLRVEVAAGVAVVLIEATAFFQTP